MWSLNMPAWISQHPEATVERVAGRNTSPFTATLTARAEGNPLRTVRRGEGSMVPWVQRWKGPTPFKLARVVLRLNLNHLTVLGGRGSPQRQKGALVMRLKVMNTSVIHYLRINEFVRSRGRLALGASLEGDRYVGDGLSDYCCQIHHSGWHLVPLGH